MSKADHPANLYADLVGPAWAELHPAVHTAHLVGDQMTATAIFRITRGANGLARLMAALARLPAASDAAPVRLSVRRVPRGEQWDRTFNGGVRLVSTQFDAGGGLLGEHFGLTDVRFRLSVRDGNLVYTQQAAYIALGGLRLPIPRALAVQVSAIESAAADGKTPRISVRVTAPLAGLLVAYEGDLAVEGAS